MVGLREGYSTVSYKLQGAVPEWSRVEQVQAQVGDKGWFGELVAGGVDGAIEMIITPLLKVFWNIAVGLMRVINNFSIEIIMSLLLICGLAMMVTPMIGGNASKWFGRTLFVLFAGTLWRMMI